MTTIDHCPVCGAPLDGTPHHPRCPYHATNLKNYRERLDSSGEARMLTDALNKPPALRAEHLTQQQLVQLHEFDAMIEAI